jgi:hypothetical protein
MSLKNLNHIRSPDLPLFLPNPVKKTASVFFFLTTKTENKREDHATLEHWKEDEWK